MNFIFFVLVASGLCFSPLMGTLSKKNKIFNPAKRNTEDWKKTQELIEKLKQLESNNGNVDDVFEVDIIPIVDDGQK